MKHQRHFDASSTTPNEAEKVRALIAELDRAVLIIESDISSEEERARVADRSDAAYPLLARICAVRRDNIKSTIAALDKRLENLARESEAA
jgi:hypothetical protein